MFERSHVTRAPGLANLVRRRPGGRRIFWIGIFALNALLAGAAPTNAAPPTEREVKNLFDMFDTNKDGRISRVEFDLNKIAVLYRGRARGQTQLNYADTRLKREVFDQIDVDRDGSLSSVEMVTSPIARFDFIDTNGDGYIDLGELGAFLTRIWR